MPLLRRQPFHKQKIPTDLRAEEEVFHCKITNEIFRDYNAFFERIILCNSLVWSCSITGKSGMTYQEAEECEDKAKKNLATFESNLKRPLLFLANLTYRSRLSDLNDDVFLFAKDRFFIGETVFYVDSDQERTSCIIVEVVPPSDEKQDGDDPIVIEDSDDDSNADPKKGKKKKKVFGADPMSYQYKVKLQGTTTAITATAYSLSRKRNHYTRDKSKLFLKQHCEPSDGLWMVKTSAIRKNTLATCKWEDIFAGAKPNFERSTVKIKKKSPNKPGTSKDAKKDSGPQVEYVPLPSKEDKEMLKEKYRMQKIEEMQKIKEEKEKQREEMKKQIEIEKIRRKEERDQERFKKMEEKRREVELYREWVRPRDDLECDDLKEMPEFVPVRTRVPMELFGDAVMILEFVHIFKSVFDFKQFFPKGCTWGMIESALMDHEPDGPLCDLLQMLLCALFNLQEEEAEEFQELEKEEKAKTDEKDDDIDDLTANEMIYSATVMAQFSQNALGMPLRDTLLDQFTLSEVVRIHLLASGAQGTSKNARFRYQQRGGYTSTDDPGLELKMEDPAVVKALSHSNVFDLSPAIKTKIVQTLIQQIVTYAMVRDIMDETAEKFRLKKYDLKQMQWAEQRRQREEEANKYKKMMEEKQQEQERRMQQLRAERDGLPLDSIPIPEEKSSEQKAAEIQKEHEMETRKKSEFSKKEMDMLEELQSMQRTMSVCPLGRDRMFRRYYFFSSLNGLFVEDHELHVPADMLTPGLAGAGSKMSLLPELSIQDNKINGKVNGGDCIVIDSDEDSRDKETKVNGENGIDHGTDGSKETKKEEVKEEVKGEVNGDVKEKVKTEIKVNGCDRDTPPLLESMDTTPEETPKSQNPTWAFIDTPEHLDALITCLNGRGFRESALKISLTELKPLLNKSLHECPSDMLSLPEEGGEEKARIQALSLTRGISSKKAAAESLMEVKAEVTMELNLRDAILDMEDRIHVGALGTLKLKDRNLWRKAILKKSYDSQSDDPLFAPNKPQVNGGHAAPAQETYPKARDLAKALVQLARGVEARFLREPLKEDESKKKKSKDKKKKEEEKDSEESDDTPKSFTLQERWEESLLTATSLSQVYLHLATLDKSILWAKSTLETRCKLCRRKGDPEKMLLCDGCDRGHHMDCLKPPLTRVPKGDWFCAECMIKKMPKSPKSKGKKRKAFVEEEEEVVEEVQEEPMEEQVDEEDYGDDTMEETIEEEEDDEDEVEEEEEEEVEEEEEAENGSDSDLNSDDDDDDDDMESKDPEDETCTGCKKEGTLICCDCCPRAYHMECAKPVLKKVPKGKWMCQVCLGTETSGKIKLGAMKLLKGKGSTKGKFSIKPKDKGTGSAKTSPSSLPGSKPGSKPGSRQESPRDSPVLGARPKKQKGSPLLEPNAKGKNKRARLSYEPMTDHSPIVRMPINPSSKRANSQQQQLKSAEELINEMIKHEDAWPFLKPVEKKLVPDYYDVIKTPMDFGTIRNKIHAFTYSKPSQMFVDVQQIFSNCIEYNSRNTPIFKAYTKLAKFFDKRVKELKLSADEPSPTKNPKSRVSV